MKKEKSCEAVAIAAEDGFRAGLRSVGIALGVLAFMMVAQTSPAQAQGFIPCAPVGKDLITIPEITRDATTHTLKGVVITADEQRNLWFGGTTCASQWMRFYKGYRPDHPDDWNVKNYVASGFPEPIPGPTLRARVGDLVEITFLNQINTLHYGNSIDRAERGQGCDTSTAAAPDWTANTKYKNGAVVTPQSNNAGKYYFTGTAGTSGASRPVFPQTQGETVKDGTVTWTNKGTKLYPGSDEMPNCIHGSSTTNIHFHGTHTTPSTTGDNVLLQIRPSTLTNGKLDVTEQTVAGTFKEFFNWCEKNGSPVRWDQLPTAGLGDFVHQQMGPWKEYPKGFIGKYDQEAPYKPAPLWPPNEDVIKKGGWPQYYIGAFPYCFRLPQKLLGDKYHMYQAPGTHWYHAHKHGSTDINVSDGMTGALIIEGDYDDKLQAFYKSTSEHTNWDLTQEVLVVQQLTTTPSLLKGGGRGPASLSVNGRQEPVLTMRPNQVQLWRIINTASRDFVTLCPFDKTSGLTWRQTAQDGVQFVWDNFNSQENNDATITLAPGNRVDLLVQASGAGSHPFNVVAGQVLPSSCNSEATPTSVLLTVNVDSNKPSAQPQMTFIDKAHYPELPKFLDDIPASEIHVHRELVFNTVGNPNSNPPPVSGKAPPNNSHFINNKKFTDEHVDQVMLLDTAEEWKMLNLTLTGGGIWHPFHIHINPFQVTEVFDPNSPDAQKGGKCYADPAKPDTWKPCPGASPKKDFIWWDVFAIPSGRQDTLSCTTKDQCPEEVRDRVSCPGGGNACTIIIPGYFKMRTRFSDFTGQYVLHCHILAHEDRGMMELVEVVPNTTIYGHH